MADRGEAEPLPDLPELADLLRGQRIESVSEDTDGAGFEWLSLELENGFRVEFPRGQSAVIVHPRRD